MPVTNVNVNWKKQAQSRIVSEQMPEKETVMVSMCCYGVGCRYHGKVEVMGHSIYKEKKLTTMSQKYNLLPLCGEQLGGLSTPREGCDVKEDPLTGDLKVVGRITKKDYTEAYKQGAYEVVRLMDIFGAKKAFLLENSPMCGKGYGILARVLESLEGYEVIKI